MKENHLSSTRFQDLDIHPLLLNGIANAGFEFCTPIQESALPIALSNTDVCGQAQTGTGKTAAFLIASMHRLLQSPPPEPSPGQPTAIRTLILAPTRELAIQIFDDAKPLAKAANLKLALAYGGSSSEKQRGRIEKSADILIGTPGRVIDFFKQRVFSLNALEVIVLDEADRMFDLGFIDDIRFLFRRMPPAQNRLSLLFSATLSLRISELAYEHLNEPKTVKVTEQSITAKKIEEIAYMPSNEEKIPLLIGLLQSFDAQKCVVFTNTKFAAERIFDWLNANAISAAILSGNVPQNKRERLLKKFKSGESTVLVATDVAARGLHIPLVKYVINFDLPNDAEDYVHRIGRTGRAGESGTAISFICEEYAFNIVNIEALTEHKIPIEQNFKAFICDTLIKPNPSKARTPQKQNHTNKKKPTQQKERRTPRVEREQPQKEHRKTARQALRNKLTREIPMVG